MSIVLSVGPPFRKPMMSNGSSYLSVFGTCTDIASSTLSVYNSCDFAVFELYAFWAIRVGDSSYAVNILV